MRAGVLDPAELPAGEIALLGDTGSRRIDRLVHDLVETSGGSRRHLQSPEVGEAMLALRTFMFERVYLGPAAQASSTRRAHDVVAAIFDHLVDHPERAARTATGRTPSGSRTTSPA